MELAIDRVQRSDVVVIVVLGGSFDYAYLELGWQRRERGGRRRVGRCADGGSFRGEAGGRRIDSSSSRWSFRCSHGDLSASEGRSAWSIRRMLLTVRSASSPPSWWTAIALQDAPASPLRLRGCSNSLAAIHHERRVSLLPLLSPVLRQLAQHTSIVTSTQHPAQTHQSAERRDESALQGASFRCGASSFDG